MNKTSTRNVIAIAAGILFIVTFVIEFFLPALTWVASILGMLATLGCFVFLVLLARETRSVVTWILAGFVALLIAFQIFLPTASGIV